MTDHDTAAVLTEKLCGPCRRGQHGVCDGGFYLPCHCGDRIHSARLAAQPPQDDPQPDEREALLWEVSSAMMLEPASDADTIVDAVLAAGYPDAGLRERVQAVLASGPESWRPLPSRDAGDVFSADSVLDFVAEVRAALAEPTPGSES